MSFPIEQTAQTAMRLPSLVIATMQNIANIEELEMCNVDDLLYKFGVTTVPEVMRLEDCRLFTMFFHASSLKSTTSFINGHPQYGDLAQINTIHRCPHHFLSATSSLCNYVCV